ncbi:MAG: glycosyltransferase [Myxococcales bacterium]|nr:MAG: glycosyltransferase [Myxococcales bacterium]
MVHLSIVVPCYNEADNLPRLLAALTPVVSDITPEFEVILVDDGSRDATLDVLRQAHHEDARIRFLSLSRNFGKESAMLAGLSQTRGAVVAIMDADLQHPPELLTRMVPMIAEGYEQVVARRNRQGDPVTRTLLARAFYPVMNRLIDVRLEDGAGDFRVLSDTAVRALLALGEYNRFSKGLFSWIGFRTATVEYDNAQRDSGSSRWRLRDLFNYGLDGLMSFNTKPLRLAIWIGAFATLVALGYTAWVIWDAVLHGNSAPGYVTIITAVVAFGGIQMMMLGVIGEYLGRIYQETKGRPHFLIAESEAGRGSTPVSTPLGPGTSLPSDPGH